MTAPFRLLLVVLASAIVAPATLSAATPQSLYDSGSAAKATQQEQSLLGPQSRNFRYDKRMLNALKIAQERARAHSTSRCWRYVKTALMAAKVIETYPKTAYAKQAGRELETDYGFKKLRVKDPFKAPLGSVLVYGGKGAGHVEIRTPSGFVSDFSSVKPSPRPLIGVYIKPKS